VSAPARPPRYGFNVQWAFVPAGSALPPPDEHLLDFLAAYGFDFLRLPTDYRAWTTGTDYRGPDAAFLGSLDAYLVACRSRGIHCR
jgi:endoglucanase